MKFSLRIKTFSWWKKLPASNFLPKTTNQIKTILQGNFFSKINTRNIADNSPIRPKSHPISRKLRKYFERKPAKLTFGLSLALFTILITFSNPSPASSDLSEPVLDVISVPLELSTKNSFQYPLEKPIIVNQGFKSWHPGVDLKGYVGDPIKPIMPGQVQAANYHRYAYGNHVIVDHGQGLVSLYAHMNKIYVRQGQNIDYTDVLGEVGTTGYSTGSHLHLEVLYSGSHLNPLTLLEK